MVDMLIIGERINSSRKSIKEAIEQKNKAFIEQEAKSQTLAGAHYIDVNAGSFIGDEEEKLKWLIEVVQGATNLPICIDSPDPKVIKAVLPLVDKKPMINSITLESSRLEGILPLVVEYKAKVIALCQTEGAAADTVDSKVDLAGKLVEKVKSANIPIDDLYIDPLVYPLATNPDSAMITLKAIEKIMKEFVGVHTTCGLTNVSHGLPARKLVNRTFLVAAIIHGLDSAILDPTDKLLYGSYKAAWMIVGKDQYCMEYIKAFREGRFE